MTTYTNPQAPLTGSVILNTALIGPAIPGLAIPEHDYVSMTYTDGNLTGVVYRMGGQLGAVVASLSLSYDGSGNLITVIKM